MAVPTMDRKPFGSRRWVVFLATLMVAVAVASFAAFQWFAGRSPKERVPLAPEPNQAVAHPLTRRTALVGLFRFVVAGESSEPIRGALGAATGYRGHSLPFQATVYPERNGRYRIVLVIPVDVKALLRRGEIMTARLPGHSDLKTGYLEINGTNATYAVRMNPRTHRARFAFAIASNDRLVWALNWNALGIVSQSAPLD